MNQVHINEKAWKEVCDTRFDDALVRPLYNSYCFSNIPGTILKLLGVNNTKALPVDVLNRKENNKVVFIFVDGFGWVSWELIHKDYPALARFDKSGIVSPITSQFPSTTSAHITTIHTGLDVGTTGIYEWYYYEPGVDAIISPIKFSFAGDKNRETLAGKVNPKEILPSKSMYKTLSSKKIKSYVFQPQDSARSSYLDVVLNGATKVISYPDLSQGLNDLARSIRSVDGPAYYFYYYGKVDSTGHTHGPNTKVQLSEMHNFFTKLEDLFFKQVEGVTGLTVLMSADHGMIDVDPDKTYYLNREIPKLIQYMKRNRVGELLTPAGSCRDYFIYVEEKELDKVKNMLQKNLQNIARIFTTKELIDMGIFHIPSNQLLNRIGNLVILPNEGEAVWWYEKGTFEQKFYGHHGGLTFKEMVVPFLSLDF